MRSNEGRKASVQLHDTRHHLGFVTQPKRFNVSITRAQALLIVIGDPTVLGFDPLWRGFMNFVHIKGGWTGMPIPWNPTAAVPVVEPGTQGPQAP